jgi:hypothetical protein
MKMAELFLVICGNREPYVAERNLADMNRETTISDLAAGEWGDIDGNRFRVSSIIEVGTDRDVTDEFINCARMLSDSYRTPYSAQNAIDWQNDRKRAEETV